MAVMECVSLSCRMVWATPKCVAQLKIYTTLIRCNCHPPHILANLSELVARGGCELRGALTDFVGKTAYAVGAVLIGVNWCPTAQAVRFDLEYRAIQRRTSHSQKWHTYC